MKYFEGTPEPRGEHPGGDDLVVVNARPWPAGGELVSVSIRGGKIDAIGPAGSDPLLEPGERRTIDAGGLSLIPGLIDVHVHFRDPGLTRKEGWVRGSRGAVHGGVTAVVEVQNNTPLSTSVQAMKERLAYVEERSLVDFGLLANLLPASLPELGGIAEDATGLKLFLGGSTGMGGQEDPETIAGLFVGAAASGRMAVTHCEHEATLDENAARYPDPTIHEHHLIRSDVAEDRSIEQAIECAARAGGGLHVYHITSALGVERVRRAKAEGLDVVASTCFHYTLLSSEDADRLGNYMRVNPSIKTPADRDAILEGLRDGTIEALSSDHAPHPREFKDRPYPKAASGMPSIDLYWPLCLELVRRGVLTSERMLASVTTDAAASMRLSDKGKLEVGYDGDLVLFDPDEEIDVVATELPSTSKWSAYEGMRLAGFPKWVVRRGEVLLENGELMEDEPDVAGGECGRAGGKPLRLEAPRPVVHAG